MQPTFRTDLTCSREEQQGVVFYRIDDPRSQTSFRLYEIEYLIAKRLDGSRELLEVIDAVKQEFNFDITEPDLQRFVSQLESMGFLAGGAPESDEGPPPSGVPTEVGVQQPSASDLDLLGEDDVLDAGSEVDKAELDRLLKSAFMHVKQGYVVHARDYFLAAKELNPSDERLGTLVNHLEIIGDASGPAEVEYLWNQAREFFPEIADEVGPLIDAKSGGPAEVGAEMAGFSVTGGEEDLRSRVLWSLVLVLVLAAGVGGLIWVVKAARLFESAAPVQVTTLTAEKLPLFHAQSAKSVQPLQERWLKLQARGKVGEVRVEPGSRVEAGEILVALELPKSVARKLAKAQKSLKKAEAAHKKAATRLSKILSDIEAVEVDKAAAEDKLKELRPKSVLRGGGVSKRDLERWKKAKVQANKKLTKLAKKRRKPKAEEAKAKKKLDAALAKVRGTEKRIGPKLLRAPFSGVVVELGVKKKQKAPKGAKAVLLRDASSIRLSFSVDEPSDLQTGGQAYVAVARGKAGQARVITVKKQGAKTQVDIKLPDPSGGLVDAEASEFRLVRTYVEPAFRVPSGAIIEGADGNHVIVAERKKALQRPVEVLEQGDATAVIRGAAGFALRNGERVVTAHLEDGDLATIEDGASLEPGGE